jgi:hypothetical protein
MNVYDNGMPDERQSAEPALPADSGLFRKRYRQLSPDEVALHDAIKEKADELAHLFAEVADHRPGRSRMSGGHESILVGIAENQAANVTLAMRHLEDAVYRAVKALTA